MGWGEWLGPCGRSAFVVITQLCCCLQPASLLSRKTSFATTDVGPSSLISRHTDGWGGAQTLVPPLTTLWLSVKAGTLRLSAWAAFFISCSLCLHGVASMLLGLNNIACGSASVYILASHLSTVLAQWVTSCPFLGGSGVSWQGIALMTFFLSCNLTQAPPFFPISAFGAGARSWNISLVSSLFVTSLLQRTQSMISFQTLAGPTEPPRAQVLQQRLPHISPLHLQCPVPQGLCICPKILQKAACPMPAWPAPQDLVLSRLSCQYVSVLSSIAFSDDGKAPRSALPSK